MAHAAKSKAKGISASSFLDLKAELAKKEGEFSRNAASGKKPSKPEKVTSPEILLDSVNLRSCLETHSMG